MKGVVFTEFLDMVEDRFSANLVDDIIDDANLPSGGAYTAVGTYSHEEIVALVSALSKRSGFEVVALLKLFGQHLFTRFAAMYPVFFENVEDAFSFLAGIEDVIHAEVLKLYPDAQLPSFSVQEHSPTRLVLIYSSGRHFEDLAEGLIQGCLAHFGEQASIERQTQGQGSSRTERFILERQD